jgi:UrcA family protein
MKMHVRLNRKIAFALSAVTAAVIVAATPATAQEDYDVVVRGLPEGARMQMVSHRDLNLNLIAHRKILDQRVGNAVREVCSVGAGNRQSTDYRMCANQAWAGARPQITRAYVRAAQLAYGNR